MTVINDEEMIIRKQKAAISINIKKLVLKLKLLELHGKATHRISSTLPVVQAAPARTIVDLN